MVAPSRPDGGGSARVRPPARASAAARRHRLPTSRDGLPCRPGRGRSGTGSRPARELRGSARATRSPPRQCKDGRGGGDKSHTQSPHLALAPSALASPSPQRGRERGPEMRASHSRVTRFSGDRARAPLVHEKRLPPRCCQIRPHRQRKDWATRAVAEPLSPSVAPGRRAFPIFAIAQLGRLQPGRCLARDTRSAGGKKKPAQAVERPRQAHQAVHRTEDVSRCPMTPRPPRGGNAAPSVSRVYRRTSVFRGSPRFPARSPTRASSMASNGPRSRRQP